MKRFGRILACIAPILAALLVRQLAALRPDWTERCFSRGIYPPIASAISFVTGLFPFSVIEVLIVLFVAFLVYFVFRGRVLRALACLSAVACIFLAGWSLNYFRLPLETTLNLPVCPSERAELIALCEKPIADVNERYTAPPDDPLSHVPAALDAAAVEWPIPTGAFSAPKPALASPLLSRLIIEGIASPFTAEALVNGGIPAFSLPFAACHEAAHVRGFAREEDANLIAYLACEASPEPYFRYSGAANALSYALSALASADIDAYRALRQTISPNVQADFVEKSAYWAPYREQKAAQVSSRVNNAYLETVGGGDQSAASYGRVVDLLLAIERKEDTR